MSELIEVTWSGEDRFIPDYGEATKGDKKMLPVEMAESFKQQGLCKIKTSIKKPDSKEELI